MIRGYVPNPLGHRIISIRRATRRILLFLLWIRRIFLLLRPSSGTDTERGDAALGAVGDVADQELGALGDFVLLAEVLAALQTIWSPSFQYGIENHARVRLSLLLPKGACGC